MQCPDRWPTSCEGCRAPAVWGAVTVRTQSRLEPAPKHQFPYRTPTSCYTKQRANPLRRVPCACRWGSRDAKYLACSPVLECMLFLLVRGEANASGDLHCCFLGYWNSCLEYSVFCSTTDFELSMCERGTVVTIFTHVTRAER